MVQGRKCQPIWKSSYSMTKALIVGTGPSLSDVLHLLPRFDGLIFTCNNTHQDVKTDVWLACDPKWHDLYGPVSGDFDKWHWDSGICLQFGYRFVEGIWMDGLYMGSENKISLNHCSGAQLLNLAANQYQCSEIVLIGHDFHYNGAKRHYFSGLSEADGEYPQQIRKYSKFDKQGQGDDLLQVYRRIADQDGLPPIYNATEGSALTWFPKRKLKDFLI